MYLSTRTVQCHFYRSAWIANIETVHSAHTKSTCRRTTWFYCIINILRLNCHLPNHIKSLMLSKCSNPFSKIRFFWLILGFSPWILEWLILNEWINILVISTSYILMLFKIWTQILELKWKVATTTMNLEI